MWSRRFIANHYCHPAVHYTIYTLAKGGSYCAKKKRIKKKRRKSSRKESNYRLNTGESTIGPVERINLHRTCHSPWSVQWNIWRQLRKGERMPFQKIFPRLLSWKNNMYIANQDHFSLHYFSHHCLFTVMLRVTKSTYFGKTSICTMKMQAKIRQAQVT